ncbi:MAG: YceI family protein [Bdellovibrionales bacterium]
MGSKFFQLCRSFLFLFLVFSISAVFAAAPATKTYKAEKPGEVKFLAVGRPSALKIKGEGAAPTGEFKETAGKVFGSVDFDLHSLKTGINMRDEHMKNKYLEVDKHNGLANLKLENLELPGDIVSGSQSSKEGLPFKGKLSLHGETKDVQGTYNLTKTATGYDVLAKFNLKLSDYKINIPSYAGITVAEDINVEIKTTAVQAKL